MRTPPRALHARALPAMALLAAALAGCTAPEPAAPEAAVPQGQAPEAGLVVTEDAANVSAQEAEASEFARSLDERFHTHNYWGGALEKTLLDADVGAAPVYRDSPSGPIDAAFTSAFFIVFTESVGLTLFELPEGSIVPPETKRLDVTVTWAESPLISGLQLGYRTARDWNITVTEPFPAGGGTLSIPTELGLNDIPHTTVSKWLFALVPHADQGPGVFNGTAHVTIKAFRDDVLYVAPPHPDFWGSATQQVLWQSGPLPIKGTRAGVAVTTATPFTENTDDSGFVFLEMPNGTLVPPHTALLRVTLNWTNAAALPNPLDLRPDLYYAAANDVWFRAPDPPQRGEGTALYTIPVEARMVDSPYAEASEWDLMVFLRSDGPVDGGWGLGSVGSFDGTFSLDVVAERETLA